MATPFTGTMTLLYTDGDVDVVPLSCTDVAAAFATHSTSGLTFVKMRKNGVIADFAFAAAATVTKFGIYVNAKDTGNRFAFAGVANTVNNRVPVPIGIAGGSDIQIMQLA